MASQLPVQPAFDQRLLVENPQQVVVLGGQQTVMRAYTANSVNNNVVSWSNILSLGQGVLIDPVAYIEYDVSITTPTADGRIFCGVNAAGALTPVNAQVGALSPTVGFAQYPLHANASSILVNINNVSRAFTGQQLFAVAKEWILTQKQREFIASSCPSANSTSAISYASTAASLYPDQPLTPSIQCRGLSRASIQAKSADIVGTNTVAVFTIRELVLVPPFSPNGGPGLGQIQSLGLTYTLDASANLRGFLTSQVDTTKVPTDPSVGCTVAILEAKLELNFITPDQSLTPIPAVCSYNYDFPDLQSTAHAVTIAADTASVGQVFTSSQKLSTVPKLYGVRICQSISGRNELNSNGAGFPISQMTIQYGNFGNYTFNRVELWRLFCKNAPEAGLTYNQWVQLGTPVLINPTLDMTGNGVFAGMQGDASVMWSNTISYTSENFYNAGGYPAAGITPASVFAYEIFIQSGSVSIGNGTAMFKDTSTTQAALVGALQEKDAPSDAALTGQDSGKGLFSSIKNVFHAAKKHAGTVAKVLPVVQSGLEALAGSGASGGMLYSRRRR
jgi:hypothetical protein